MAAASAFTEVRPLLLYDGGKGERANRFSKANEPLHDLRMAWWVNFINFKGSCKVRRKFWEKQLFLYY